MTPAERAAYQARIDDLHKAAERDLRLMLAGQAALDWAQDTGSCLFCEYHNVSTAVTTVLYADSAASDAKLVERGIPHDDECPLKGIES